MVVLAITGLANLTLIFRNLLIQKPTRQTPKASTQTFLG